MELEYANQDMEFYRAKLGACQVNQTCPLDETTVLSVASLERGFTAARGRKASKTYISKSVRKFLGFSGLAETHMGNCAS